MSNKDMPADPVIQIDLNVHHQNIILYALHVAIPHMHSHAAKRDAQDMLEAIKAARKAALAELEGRELNKQGGGA